MPTRGRSEWARKAIDVFMSQTYEHKSLYILDDSNDPSFPDPTGLNEGPFHHWSFAGGNIPQKRNMLTKWATDADVLFNLDSDDWSSQERMALQVERLEQSGKAVTGFAGIYFYEVKTGAVGKYGPRRDPYVLGSSLCFRREFALANPFPEHKHIGSDNKFVAAAVKANQLDQIHGFGLMVARVHSGNTSPKYMKSFVRAESSDLPQAFHGELVTA